MTASHRENSFDFIRFAAAISVVISHHFALAGYPEPYVPLVQDTLGGAAVCVFFVISGFLIHQSLGRQLDWSLFLAARILRMLPNLIFALITTSAAFLIIYRNFSNLQDHIAYVVHNAQMFYLGVKYQIKGVLMERPVPGVNGSLWTLPYEVWMYTILFFIFIFRESIRILISVVLIVAFWNL